MRDNDFEIPESSHEIQRAQQPGSRMLHVLAVRAIICLINRTLQILFLKGEFTENELIKYGEIRIGASVQKFSMSVLQCG